MSYCKVFEGISLNQYCRVYLSESHPGRLCCCLPACLPALPLVHAVATDRSTRLTEEWNPFVQCDATVEILLVDSTLHLVHIVCDRNPGRDHACRRWGGGERLCHQDDPSKYPSNGPPFFPFFPFFLFCVTMLS